MLNVNWKIRVKNPVFWAQVVCAIVLPLIVGVGMNWKDMTSWSALGSTILLGLQNPVVFVSMVTSLWACITDPTTAGTSDSPVALAKEIITGNVNSSDEGGK